MKKKIFQNWGLKLTSLILAVFIWIIVVQMGDPPNEKNMGAIPVKLVNTELLEKENKVYSVLDRSDTVRVTVYAPASVFERLRSSDIMAEADVSRLTDINTVPITFSTSIANVISIEGDREVVKLDVEDRKSKFVNLVSSWTGEVADGYMVTGITPDQNRIEVSGPKSIVEQVKYAGVEIDVTDATSNLTANIDIKLYDADNNLVEHDNLVKNVDYVRLSVEVLAVKEVPVEVSFTGMPADGYMATGEVDHEPDMVKLAGSVAVLSRINVITIPEDKLDITDASANLEKTVDIKEFLPDNVKLVETEFNGKVSVTVHIEPVVQKTLRIPADNITVANIPTGLTVEVEDLEDKFYMLEVQGLGAQINPLQQNSPAGIIDIEAWMGRNNTEELVPGTYDIPVTFELDDGIVIKNPATVRVTVKKEENG